MKGVRFGYLKPLPKGWRWEVVSQQEWEETTLEGDPWEEPRYGEHEETSNFVRFVFRAVRTTEPMKDPVVFKGPPKPCTYHTGI